MNRREAIAGGVLAVAAPLSGAVLPTAPTAPDTPLRPVWRWDIDHWTRVRMYEVKPGDTISIALEDGTRVDGVAREHPQKEPGRHWGVIVVQSREYKMAG